MTKFVESFPSTESYWRSIILFGINAASYKFALGKALLKLADAGETFVSLEELALPFARHVSEHIKLVDKQGQRPTGPFLDACRKAARNEIDDDALRLISVKYGFQNVIDAFHVVNKAPIPVAFFEDVRAQRKGIVITDALLSLKETSQFASLPIEIEGRWRLVETAWALNTSRNLLQIDNDEASDYLYTTFNGRRKTVTSSRSALNGYQKGKCFYCFDDISIGSGENNLADVDHFFPWILNRDRDLMQNWNGIWNLVLACNRCNRGEKGKFAAVPALKYLDRLQRRNSFLIESHHPLRETLMRQTGLTEQARFAFLQDRYNDATARLFQHWQAPDEQEAAF
jgi:5-methylcytosine-specific restriction endonuclease McrA